MKLNDLFELYQGNGFRLTDMTNSNSASIDFISRTSQNNGIVATVDPYDSRKPFDAGLITVALSGNGVCSAFVQKNMFYTAYHVMVLKPKREMLFNEKLYYCMCIKNNAYKYAWNRQANKTLKDLELPEDIPDFVYEEKVTPLKTNISVSKMGICCDNWREFFIGGDEGVFDLKKGYYNKKPDHTAKGCIPFIGATEANNGVTGYYSLEDIKRIHKDGSETPDDISKKLFPGNCIVVTNNGSVGHAYYQKDRFTCSHDVNPLYLKNKELNKYIALFLCTIIEKDRYRWAYGRKWRPERMVKSTIKLPSKRDGSPDFDYMETYVKSLPYSDKL